MTTHCKEAIGKEFIVMTSLTQDLPSSTAQTQWFSTQWNHIHQQLKPTPYIDYPMPTPHTTDNTRQLTTLNSQGEHAITFKTYCYQPRCHTPSLWLTVPCQCRNWVLNYDWLIVLHWVGCWALVARVVVNSGTLLVIIQGWSTVRTYWLEYRCTVMVDTCTCCIDKVYFSKHTLGVTKTDPAFLKGVENIKILSQSILLPTTNYTWFSKGEGADPWAPL